MGLVGAGWTAHSILNLLKRQDMNSREYAVVDQIVRDTSTSDTDQVLSFAEGSVFIPSFVSAHSSHLLGGFRHECRTHSITFDRDETDGDMSDSSVAENIRFRYPLIRQSILHAGYRRYDRAIIILHGLNERSFAKYLPWGLHLHLRTEAPISFVSACFPHEPKPSGLGGCSRRDF